MDIPVLLYLKSYLIDYRLIIMFLGQIVTSARTNNQIHTFDPNIIGAIHFSQLGYTGVTLTGNNLNETYTLDEGYNLSLIHI